MKGNCGECERRYFCEINPDKCDEWPDPVPKTNADRIRAMTDEELAEMLADDNRACPPRHHNCRKYIDKCDGCWLEWLQKPCVED